MIIMKKSLLLLLILFPTICFPQGWKKKQVLDEFGDATNLKTHQVKVIGSFDNSAQTGSRAILFLEYDPRYSEYRKSIGTLSFQVYEYGNNPADFYRKSRTISLALKNSKGEVLRSEILPNEFDSDNAFWLGQFLYPNERIEKMTIKNKLDENTYELTKPTYDIDYEIVEEIIFKKQEVKLNIYSENSSYYFVLNSLGLKHTEEDLRLIEEAKNVIEQKKKETENLKYKQQNKNLFIDNLISNSDSKELNELSQKSLKRFLNVIDEDELFTLESLKIGLVIKSAASFEIIERVYQNSNIVNIRFIKKNGDILDISKYTKQFSTRFDAKIIEFLNLKEGSLFPKKYLSKLKTKIESLNKQIDEILDGKFNIDGLKKEIKRNVEFDILLRNVSTINKLKVSVRSDTFFKYSIEYGSGYIRDEIISAQIREFNYSIKKLSKKRKIVLDKEYILYQKN
jgi:hypothetical protein